jgi:D-beta-D-heptose 7-phosphate kinase/D-beta-D-heptose 1-phosphate adenosyltransferase
MKRFESLQNKVLSGVDLERWLTIVRFRNQKIVLTTGSFDLLHQGHVRFLAEAKDKGDHLVVALGTDAWVRKRLGEKRPLLDLDDRSVTMAALYFVSAVVQFDDASLPELIRIIRPDFLAVRRDGKDQDGSALVQQLGGEVVTMGHDGGTFTDDIMNRITTG